MFDEVNKKKKTIKYIIFKNYKTFFLTMARLYRQNCYMIFFYILYQFRKTIHKYIIW